MKKKSSILIVEDHALTAFALKASLEGAEFADKIFSANCAKDAYKILEENPIELVLLDIGLPDITGIEACEYIREKYPKIKIVILTSHSERDEVTKCLKAGINAYCTKDIKPAKLNSVIEDVLSGSMYFDAAVSNYVLNNSTNAAVDTQSANCYNLTRTEKKVLILLASGNSNLEIAKKMKISVNTTKVHVCSILQKLKVEDRTRAAIKAIRENLIL